MQVSRVDNRASRTQDEMKVAAKYLPYTLNGMTSLPYLYFYLCGVSLAEIR